MLLISSSVHGFLVSTIVGISCKGCSVIVFFFYTASFYEKTGRILQLPLWCRCRESWRLFTSTDPTPGKMQPSLMGCLENVREIFGGDYFIERKQCFLEIEKKIRNTCLNENTGSRLEIFVWRYF